MVGGTERYYFDLSDLLTSKGHEVAYFSMLDTGNEKTKWKKYFVDNMDFSKRGGVNFFQKIKRMLYSLEAKSKIGNVLDDFKPDIVHINNIYYYISPSILGEIKKRGIPIVQTVHDYQLMSPNVILFFKGSVCEITKKHKYYKALFDRKTKGYYMASIMAVITSYIQYIFKFYERHIDLFITPSNFLKNKLVEYDFNSKKIIVLPNFINHSNSINIQPSSGKKYLLYFGRIAEHKGVLLLLRLAKDYPEIKIKMIGKYADKKIEFKIKDYLKKGSGNLEIIKLQNKYNLYNWIKNSNFVVVPSLWFETQSYSVMESFALGKTVVASRIGGIPEFVRDGKTGYLFNPNNYDEFKNKIFNLWNNDRLTEKMGREALKFVTKKHNANNYYRRLMKIYNRLLR